MRHNKAMRNHHTAMKTVTAETHHDAAMLEADAERRLRNASVRVTAARLRVLSVLINARSACSHQDVQDRLADMDRVTLYRALDCLTDAGVAHKIAGDDRVFRYSAGNDPALASEKAAAGAAQHEHGHFKCLRCAKVYCLDTGNATLLHGMLPDRAERQSTARKQLNKVLQETLKQALGDGFQSHDIELTIKGWCPDCTRQDL